MWLISPTTPDRDVVDTIFMVIFVSVSPVFKGWEVERCGMWKPTNQIAKVCHRRQWKICSFIRGCWPSCQVCWSKAIWARSSIWRHPEIFNWSTQSYLCVVPNLSSPLGLLAIPYSNWTLFNAWHNCSRIDGMIGQHRLPDCPFLQWGKWTLWKRRKWNYEKKKLH